LAAGDFSYNVNMDVFLLIPALVGLAAGGLINYLADVLPLAFDDEPPAPVRRGRPVCPARACHAPFAWTDYLLLRRCPACRRGRGLRTYATLLLSAALFVFIWISPPRSLGFALGSLVLAYLLLVAIIDLEHRLILRPLSIAGLVLAAPAGVYAHGWASTLVGGAAGFGIVFLFYLFGRLVTRWRTRRLAKADDEPAFGSGDVTLAAILGLLLGWPLIWFDLLLGVLISGAIAILIIIALGLERRYKQKAFDVFIPYGPAFILGAFLLIYLPLWMSSLLPG
jgi:leader peptidase (prepilin peptidase)/N-methyltransferase